MHIVSRNTAQHKEHLNFIMVAAAVSINNQPYQSFELWLLEIVFFGLGGAVY